MGALANYASVGLQTGFYNNQLKYGEGVIENLKTEFRQTVQIINNYMMNDDESV